MTKLVVITGSTRGIGFALAGALLERGCQVVVSSRSQQAVNDAVGRLVSRFSSGPILGVTCDVTDFTQLQRLWEQSINHYGHVDIWINNAGTAAPRQDLWELPPEKYDEVVRTNLIGTLNGSKVALSAMLAQGFGALYNMEGFGARGPGMQGMTLYGSTKAAVHFINKTLALEVKDTPVIVGALAPGMMITDMVTRQYVGREAELEKVKPILNIIAERPETVAPVLAEKILKNRKNGATIAYTSAAMVMMKFLAAPFRKRDLFTPPSSRVG